MFIERACIDDLPTVLDVLDEAAAWLHGQGIRQWPTKFSGEGDWREDRLQGYVEAGDAWLVRTSNGEAVATFMTGGPDPHYAHGWPDDPDKGLYVYRMAVRRKYAGQGIGDRILDWCGSRAVAEGYEWLRLDCHRKNDDLQRYYEIRGFTRVATVVHTMPDGGDGNPYTRGSGALYQRPAGAITTGVFAVKDPAPSHDEFDYDPNGTASLWDEAAQIIQSLKLDEPPVSEDAWNAALDQAARELARRSSEIRQLNGAYYRVLDGNGHG